jgi:beta-glucosidase
MLERFSERTGAPGDALKDGDLRIIGGGSDFLGVNYYNPQRIKFVPGAGPLEYGPAEATPPLTAMGWEIDAGGLRDILVRVRREYGPIPIYITENGAAFDDPPVNGDGCVDDPERTQYLSDHMEAVREAIAAGVDVQRYCLWSLMDNFEWENGYSKRFGIVHVDYETQRRVPKRSGLWYRDYIASIRNGAARVEEVSG